MNTEIPLDDNWQCEYDAIEEKLEESGVSEDVLCTIRHRLAMAVRIVHREEVKMRDLTILIDTVLVPTDPRIRVYKIELFNDDSCWHETFTDMQQVNAFLRGFGASASMVAGVLLSLPRLAEQPNSI